MKKYDLEIISLLLDKYERSKSFTGNNVVKQSFSVDLRKEFPEYADDSKIETIRSIDDTSEVLEKKGFVFCNRYKKNGLLKSVTLNTERLDDCYIFLKRKPKQDINGELEELFSRYLETGTVLDIYCKDQLQRIKDNKRVKHFNGDIDELEKVLIAIKAIFSVEEETYERDFSIRLFSDSKVFEKIRGTVISILYEYGDYPEKNSILEELNIIRNPGMIYFKGNAILTISGQVLDLTGISGGIAISSQALKDINSIVVKGSNIITIENLTTFNTFDAGDSLVIYLGGYHNTARRDFIKNLYKQNQNASYYHYGDIDAGGFYILLHLRDKTGIHFKPLNMDIDTLKSNIRYAKPLTENDVKRLNNLLGGEFDDVITYMLNNNCKLEQEALD